MSLTKKIQYKQSGRARKITEKNRLKKKIRDCLRKAERYKTDINHCGKLKKKYQYMKGGYFSNKQITIRTRSISGLRNRSRTRSKSRK